MWNAVLKTVLTALIIVAVSQVGQRSPRWGALLLSLPLTSILAFSLGWFEHRNLPQLSRMARETLVLVPLGLPFFVPLAFAERWHLSFGTAIGLGIVMASATIGAWMAWGPSTS
jgi:hypothetical protein